MASPDTEAVEREVRIPARPETIFPFFTDPAKMARWKGIHATLDPQPGGVYRVNINGRDVARGEYVEIVPYSRIVFTWGWEDDGSPVPPGSSTVEVLLIPDGEATIVRLRHSGLPRDQHAIHREGWDHFLPRLMLAVEEHELGSEP